MAVIHHRDDPTSLGNATAAVNAGCNGVFLIHMDGHDDLIDGAAVQIKSMFPELLVGTNRLMTPRMDSIRRDVELMLDATWCDNPGIRSDRGLSPMAHELSDKVRQIQTVRPSYLYFGSVAFKYQEEDPDPAKAAVLASQAGFIPTTSGPGTGEPPHVEKLAMMKTALGDRPLAVASGITPENVAEMAPHVDWILVATGVSRTFHEFDPGRLSALVTNSLLDESKTS